MSIARHSLSFFLGVLLVGVTLPGVSASEVLRGPLADAAKTIGSLLKAEGQDSVSVGQFTGPPTFAAGKGPGIRLMLIEELKKVGIREKRVGGAVGLEGKYTLKSDQSVTQNGGSGRKYVSLDVRLVDSSGEVLSRLNRDVMINQTSDFTGEAVPIRSGHLKLAATPQDDGLVGELIGATADLGADPLKTITDSMLKGRSPFIDSFSQPTAKLYDGGFVASSGVSPYFIRLIVNGQAAKITLEDGHPFVQLAKDDEFAIEIQNQGTSQIGVRLTIDGVSSFAFANQKRGESKLSRWLISPKESTAVNGWYLGDNQYDRFKVTDFSDSAAAKFGSQSDVGTITVAIQATWRQDQERPADEPQIAFSSPIAVGQGERQTYPTFEDTSKRAYGWIRSVITIRYVKPS